MVISAPGGLAFGGARGATLQEGAEEAPGDVAAKGTDGKEIEGGDTHAEETQTVPH